MRPIVAVSSCLLGQAVRYDGTDKHQAWITQELAKQFDLQALCPEVSIGLGVPRPAIHLRKHVDNILLLGLDDPSQDFTVRMQQHAHQIVGQLQFTSGYIFKSKSPSCGLNDVKLMHENGDLSHAGKGLYSNIIRAQLPDLPVVDEQQLNDELERQIFIEAVLAYAAAH